MRRNQIVVRARGGGKTHEMILAAARTGATIVCPSSEQCRYVKARAEEMGMKIAPPMVFGDILSGRGLAGREVRGLLFDNLDMMLGELSRGVPVFGASWTEDWGE